MEKMSLAEDSLVNLSLANHQLMIKPIRQSVSRLEKLVSKINSSNRQTATEWGKPIGRELW
jgi:antitoxin component of MazEF toxin-antitoxin module